MWYEMDVNEINCEDLEWIELASGYLMNASNTVIMMSKAKNICYKQYFDALTAQVWRENDYKVTHWNVNRHGRGLF